MEQLNGFLWMRDRTAGWPPPWLRPTAWVYPRPPLYLYTTHPVGDPNRPVKIVWRVPGMEPKAILWDGQLYDVTPREETPRWDAP